MTIPTMSPRTIRSTDTITEPGAGVPYRRCPLGHAVCRLPLRRWRQHYWRFANFLFPFSVQVPAGEFDKPRACARLGAADDGPPCSVPALETRHLGAAQPQPAVEDGRPIAAPDAATSSCPTPRTGSERSRLAADESTDWSMDRAAQQSNEIYSGIDGVHLQDQAITERNGPMTTTPSSTWRDPT